MRVGYFQFRPRFGQIEKNCDRVVNALAGADADLVVLPELPFTGYYFRNRSELRKLAEDPRRSTTVERLRDLCRQRGFRLVTGFAEKDGDRLFNSALLIGPRGLARTYRKIHLFDQEKRWFDPGDLPRSAHGGTGIDRGIREDAQVVCGHISYHLVFPCHDGLPVDIEGFNGCSGILLPDHKVMAGS